MHVTTDYDWWSLALFLVIILAIIIIIWGEYVSHDCIEHKTCTHSAERPSPNDETVDYIEKLQGMVDMNNDFVIWRRALLAALIAVIPIVYYLRGRMPTWVEALVVILIVYLHLRLMQMLSNVPNSVPISCIDILGLVYVHQQGRLITLLLIKLYLLLNRWVVMRI